MSGEVRAVLAAMRGTLADPVLGGQWLLGRQLTLPQGLMALLAVGCLVALAGGPSGLAMPLPEGRYIHLGPAQYALLFFTVNLGLSAGLTLAGRWLGGTGSFAEGVVTVAWLNLVMLAVQIVAVLVLLLLPSMTGLVSLALLAVLLWTLFGLTRALHRFETWPRTIGCVVIGMLLAGLAMSLALTPFLAGSLADV